MELLVRVEGRAGRITLNRPAALNALTHAMSLAIERALAEWRDDARVALVLVDGAGERAFCAGGDVAALHRAVTAGDLATPRRFWADEYRMNLRLAQYTKPVVALLHGFVMGGGVGIGCHAGHRIVGETARLAMPECGIGLIPDVGGTRLLARAPGCSGRYLGLTGTRMGPGDALFAGFADRFVPQDRWPELVADLVRTGEPASVARHAAPAPASELERQQEWIAQAFAPGPVAEVMARLSADGSDRAAAALRAMQAASPLSLAATAEALERARGMTLAQALALEYRFTFRAPDRSDFAEGVRALIVDKDRRPRWRHASAAAVTPDEVAAMLAPLGADELTLEQETTP